MNKIFLGLLLAVVGCVAVKTNPYRRTFVPPPGTIESHQSQSNDKIEVHAYDEALKQAKAHDRHIVLFFTATWCPPCKYMKQTVLPQAEVQQALAKYIYCKVDVDDNRGLSSKFSVSGIPTFIIVDKDGKEIKRQVGSMSKNEFIRWLDG